MDPPLQCLTCHHVCTAADPGGFGKTCSSLSGWKVRCHLCSVRGQLGSGRGGKSSRVCRCMRTVGLLHSRAMHAGQQLAGSAPPPSSMARRRSEADPAIHLSALRLLPPCRPAQVHGTQGRLYVAWVTRCVVWRDQKLRGMLPG